MTQNECGERFYACAPRLMTQNECANSQLNLIRVTFNGVTGQMEIQKSKLRIDSDNRYEYVEHSADD